MKDIIYLTGKPAILCLTTYDHFYRSLRMWYLEENTQVAFCYFKRTKAMRDHNNALRVSKNNGKA